MKLRVLIPVRPFEEGKQRLSSLLSPAARHALNACFFSHTIDVARSVVEPHECIVVSRSTEVLDLARRAGMYALREQPPGGLNPALEQAAAKAREADAVLSLSCDLPLLEPDDLRALIARAAPGKVVLGVDRTGEGTNALLMSPPGAIAYCYGQSSHDAHRTSALERGLAFETILRPNLANDVDTPADLEALASHISPQLLRLGSHLRTRQSEHV
ncbi:MAG TPA: 2-phospho-L-lactate guanylyltransferase [Steroidobacteraceae bacterium]